jgi:hypothetical protein
MKWLMLIFLLILPFSVMGQTTQTAAQVKLQTTTEDGKRQLQATVTADGKPVEGATVVFTVKRTFGELPVGKDQTLDDGTAAVAFPGDLPGGETGELHVMATVQAPSRYAGAMAYGMFDGAAKVQPAPEEFPRALWAPRAPVTLLVTIVVILAAVWFAYAYVVAQLWAIARER